MSKRRKAERLDNELKDILDRGVHRGRLESLLEVPPGSLSSWEGRNKGKVLSPHLEKWFEGANKNMPDLYYYTNLGRDAAQKLSDQTGLDIDKARERIFQKGSRFNQLYDAAVEDNWKNAKWSGPHARLLRRAGRKAMRDRRDVGSY